jgi:hypothetical protein
VLRAAEPFGAPPKIGLRIDKGLGAKRILFWVWDPLRAAESARAALRSAFRAREPRGIFGLRG